MHPQQTAHLQIIMLRYLRDHKNDKTFECGKRGINEVALALYMARAAAACIDAVTDDNG